MCGIAGCIGERDIETVNKMLDALPHRGPNDRGIHVNGNSVFGHTRLSIVDVAKGHQPILANNDRRGIICNGEIYNFRDVREKFLRNYDFKTDSDTEVILHLYQEKGPECVKELDGMFAFAIFDDENFMMARDPIGIKPLYYGRDNGSMYFTSELGAMTLAGVEEVHEFPAGHYYTPKEGFVAYYQVPEIQDHMLTDIDETCEIIRTTFIDAVKKRLLADPEVPAARVMTSCNRAEEPIATEADAVLTRLRDIVDGVLTHDRKIANRCDDSLVAVFRDATLPMSGRGRRSWAPAPCGRTRSR